MNMDYSPEVLGDPYYRVQPYYDSSFRPNAAATFLIDVHTNLSIPLLDDDDDDEAIEDSVDFCEVLPLSAEIMMKEDDDNAEATAAIDAFLANRVNVPSTIIDSITDEIISCGRTMWNNSDPSNRVLCVKVDINVFVDFLPADQEDLTNTEVNFRFLAASKEAIEGLERVIVGSDQVDASCSVCLEDVLAGSEATKLPCSHLYHGDCIVKWLQNSKYCPLCRFEMSS